MITTYILIYFIYIQQKPTSGSIEFTDKFSCVKASEDMQKAVSEATEGIDRHAFICVEKMRIHK